MCVPFGMKCFWTRFGPNKMLMQQEIVFSLNVAVRFGAGCAIHKRAAVAGIRNAGFVDEMARLA